MYNAAACIRRTIHSILQLGLHDYEIICVDDASKDETAALVSDIAQQYSVIQCITLEENKGVSHARNIGVQHASKDFIYFVDADDCCTQTFFKHVNLACDIVIGQHTIVRNGQTQDAFNFGFKGTLNKQAIRALSKAYLLNPVGNSIIVHCWGKLYRRQFLYQHQILFNERMSIYEDIDFIARCLHHANHIEIASHNTYQKNMTADSLSNNFVRFPFSYQHAIQVLANDVGESFNDAHLLYITANSHFIIRSLSLAKSLALADICAFIKKLQSELQHVDYKKINNRLMYWIIRSRIYKIAPLTGAILRIDYLLKNKR